MLRHLPLGLREAWAFSISPTDPDDVPVASALLTLATAYASRRRVTPAALMHAPLAEARSEMELQQVCGCVWWRARGGWGGGEDGRCGGLGGCWWVSRSHSGGRGCCTRGPVIP